MEHATFAVPVISDTSARTAVQKTVRIRHVISHMVPVWLVSVDILERGVCPHAQNTVKTTNATIRMGLAYPVTQGFTGKSANLRVPHIVETNGAR